eukprot:TRINITY_DN1999_c3_g1_i1.p1 TRINITY_DN1999_c3_g1~~TRINITY_DN1999_c3_g1_i1.p1  ORF type:complete len:486 (-),score=109.57 TRINITY_DN1999_c3_g1_i1:176-1633(-)
MKSSTATENREGGHAVRGIGLTPRLFESLVKNPDAHLEALPATYVPAINHYVTSAMMAQTWCPVVVEEDSGLRRVLHVDPLAVRQFRSTVSQELKDVKEKRKRVIQRIQNIRKHLPQVPPRQQAERIEQEIEDAQVRASEPLTRPIPSGAWRLTVIIEVSPRMVQLQNVCKHLADELPTILQEAGTTQLSLVVVGTLIALQKNTSCDTEGKRSPSHKVDGESDDFCTELELLDFSTSEALQAAQAWLNELALRGQKIVSSVSSACQEARHAPGTPKPMSKGSPLHLAETLRKTATADALAGGGGAAIVVACSPPADTEACATLLQRSELVLQIAGVLGVSPEDPEQSLERLVNSAAPGSKLHLFFGHEYWTKFAAARSRQLEFVRAFHPGLNNKGDEDASFDPTEMAANLPDEVVSADMLEVRLLERIMRECYVEEQRCEEELACSGQVLARTLVDPEDVKAAMKIQKEIKVAQEDMDDIFRATM